MTPTLTVERLIEILTKCSPDQPQGVRIPENIYIVKRQILSDRYDRIISVLIANHWDKVDEFTKGLSSNTIPLKFLLRVRKSITYVSSSMRRTNDLIYGYLTELYAVLTNLRLIEASVEWSITYEEMTY